LKVIPLCGGVARSDGVVARTTPRIHDRKISEFSWLQTNPRRCFRWRFQKVKYRKREGINGALHTGSCRFRGLLSARSAMSCAYRTEPVRPVARITDERFRSLLAISALITKGGEYPPFLVVADCAKSRLRASAKARSLRRSSSPMRTHYVGLRIGCRRGL